MRDYLEAIRWNKQPPVPALPDDVVQRTREKYLEAFRLLTGRELAVSGHALCDLLDRLVDEMVKGGITFDEGRAGSSAVHRTRRSTTPTGTSDTRPTSSGMHRNTLTRKMAEYRIQ